MTKLKNKVMNKAFPIEDIVKETIRRHIGIAPNSIVLAGISGGADSVCLLYLLHSISKEFNFSLEAAHVNHMLRGSESDGDEEYVRSLCEQLGITLHVSKFNIRELARSKRISLEEAGREARYGEFNRIADVIGADTICVAHNQNDQAETVMMNLIRGAGLDGLEGMDYRSGRVARPLLDIPRKEVELFCEKKGLKPRIDSSNLEMTYIRNKIRLRLFPFIKDNFGRDITSALSKMAGLLRSDNDFIESAAAETFGKVRRGNIQTNSVLLDSKELTKIHEAISSRVIRMAIAEIRGDVKGIEQKHIAEVAELVKSGQTGTAIHLPHGIRVRKSYDTIEILMKDTLATKPKFELDLRVPGKTVVPECGMEIETEIIDKNPAVNFPEESRTSFLQYFDYDLLNKGIKIRNRRNGDRISPKGFSGTKKLKDYLIDRKIQRHERDDIVLIADGNEIVWAVGLETSEKFRVSDTTKNILRLKTGKIT